MNYLSLKLTDVLIFIFGDAYERSNAFINKIFNPDITDQKRFNKLDLNPPTEKEILGVLKWIAVNENLNNVSDD